MTDEEWAAVQQDVREHPERWTRVWEIDPIPIDVGGTYVRYTPGPLRIRWERR